MFLHLLFGVSLNPRTVSCDTDSSYICITRSVRSRTRNVVKVDLVSVLRVPLRPITSTVYDVNPTVRINNSLTIGKVKTHSGFCSLPRWISGQTSRSRHGESSEFTVYVCDPLRKTYWVHLLLTGYVFFKWTRYWEDLWYLNYDRLGCLIFEPHT